MADTYQILVVDDDFSIVNIIETALKQAGYLAKSGDGEMTYRYSNFMYDGPSSLLTVIKSVILNPVKAVYECVDTEKLYFIAMTLLPFLGLPLLTR